MTRTWTDVEFLVDARAVVGESPVWDEERGVLLWVDIPGNLLHTFDPRTGSDEAIPLAGVVGAVVLRHGGGLVAAVHAARVAPAVAAQPAARVAPAVAAQPAARVAPAVAAQYVGFADLDPSTGGLEMIASVEEPADPPTRMNDGKCDVAGRFWAGTMAYDLTPGAAGFYRLDPDGAVHQVLDDVTLANGLDWSLDGRTFYYIDTMAGGIDAFDFDVPTGTLSNRRCLIDIPQDEGLPDGMTVDAEGYLWVALYLGGCVRRYAPDGTLDGIVELPIATPTCPVFGGEDLTDLYITTAAIVMGEPSTEPGAGGLYRCHVGVKGRVANRFGAPA